MKHEFSDTLRADPERFELAQKAAKLLDRFSYATRLAANAHWQLPTDGSESLVEVDLRESDGSRVIRRVTPYERDDRKELEHRMIRTWGDLLEEVSKRRMREWTEFLSDPTLEVEATRA